MAEITCIYASFHISNVQAQTQELMPEARTPVFLYGPKFSHLLLSIRNSTFRGVWSISKLSVIFRRVSTYSIVLWDETTDMGT